MRLVSLLLAITLALPAAARPPAAPAPSFANAPCMVDLSQYAAAEGRDAVCGYLTVPELHANPAGPSIQLAVMIIKSTSASPARDPIVMLQGGPGGSTIDTYSQVLFTTGAGLRAQHDVILFDQRGTLYSKPALECSEDRVLLDQTLERRLTRAEGNRLSVEAAAACHDRLQKAGVNLAAFNSLENAADVEDLRVALGYDQINLYGVSYGTLLAQHVMRDFPQALRSVVIDAVVPTSVNFVPDVARSGNRAFGELFAACAADPACNASYPNLEQTLTQQIARLNQAPARVPLTDPDSGKTYQMVFDGESLQDALFQMIYATELLPLLPAAIDRVTHDDFTIFSNILPLFFFDHTVSTGMYYSVICAEDADYRVDTIPIDDLRPIFADDARPDAEALQQACQRWGVADLGPLVDAPVPSDIPTLVFSGRFDPITPPAYAAVVASALPNSYSFTFPNTGHGALTSAACASSIAEEFWRNPNRAPDSSCIDTLGPPAFMSRATIIPSGAAATLLGWLNGRNLLWLGVLAVALVVLLSLFLIWPLVWLIRLIAGWRAEPRPAGARLATAAAVLAGLLGLVFVVGLAVAIFAGGLDGLISLTIGFPRSALLVLVLAPIVALLALVMLVCAGLAWLRGYWSVAERGYYTLLALAAAVFSLALGATGLLTALVV